MLSYVNPKSYYRLVSYSGFAVLAKKVTTCSRCPRLRAHCSRVAKTKRRSYRNQTYWGKPVAGFGDPSAWLWIVGLAPGAHGANRTGRVFTGDASGEWLYQELFRRGLCNQPASQNRFDGMKLSGVYISCAARCAPPGNRPTPRELQQCSGFLEREWDLLQNKKVVLALGKIAFEATLKLLASKANAPPRPHPVFGHAKEVQIGNYRLVASYHPSRQNTQTGRLTLKMWKEVFKISCHG